MPKFNIGDKVKIKNVSGIYGRAYNGFEGIVVAIYNYNKYWVNLYTPITSILLDESMLEPVKEDNPMTMPTLETGMIVINKHDKVGVVAGNEIWYNDGGVDDVKEVLMYLERNKFDDYIKYIIKNKSGFKHIQNNLPNIKANKTVTGIEILWKYEEPIQEVTLDQIYEKFGHKVKIVPNPLDKSE